jgi:hypothetical protein
MQAVLRHDTVVPGRSEVRYGRITEGQERWVGCRIYRPDQDQFPRICMFQLGPISGSPDHPGRGLYQIIAQRYGGVPGWSLKGFLSRVTGTDREETVGPVVLRSWDDWVMHIKVRSDDQGLIELWRNGDQMLSWTGPNAFPLDSIPVKWGAYIGSGNATTDPITVLYDDVVIADETARYEDVAPGHRSPLVPWMTGRTALAVWPGTDVSTTLTASGRPWTAWTASDLPAWLRLDPATGTLYGMVPADFTGLMNLHLSVSNAHGTATGQLLLGEAAQVLPQVVTTSFRGTVGIPVTTLPGGSPGWRLLTAAIAASPSYRPPFWIRYQGLPQGLTGDTAFRVTGTPQIAGRYLVLIDAENDFGIFRGTVTLEIAPAVGTALPTLSGTPNPVNIP